jgi:hypothetical protein
MMSTIDVNIICNSLPDEFRRYYDADINFSQLDDALVFESSDSVMVSSPSSD